MNSEKYIGLDVHQATISIAVMDSLTFATLLSSNISAQQSKVLAPHQPIPPLVTKEHQRPLPPARLQSLVGGPWMIGADFKSTLYLKNGVESSSLTATPILHLSNGRRFALPPVSLEPSGTSVININEALAQQEISPWATLSGYVEIQYNWPFDAICATIRNVDTAHSLIFTHLLRSLNPPKPPNSGSTPTENAANTVEGLWWKQERDVTGFVSLSNVYPHPITATVQVLDDSGNTIGRHSATITAYGTKKINLDELQQASASQGGVRITYAGTEQNEPITSGALVDPNEGYSATMHFFPAPLPSALPKQISFAALGLMVGAADPMMSFPADTNFTPYLVLRNTSDVPVSVRPTVWWMQNGSPRSAGVPELTLPPSRTQSVDVMSLMSGVGLKNFNGSVSLTLDVQGKSGSLLVGAGSVDQTNTYVFEVRPQAIRESASKSLSYWSTGDGDDTMVTLWNPADEAQDFLFKLLFSGGHYSLPIHLDPRATRTFNISEIIESQIPDAEGNTIPVSIHSGSARIAGSHADNEIVLVAMDAGTYNVRKATCGNYCVDCNGYEGFDMIDNPFGVTVSGQKQQTVQGLYDTGVFYDLTSTSTWNSSNTSIATVLAGLVKGVAVGSLTMTTTQSQIPMYYDGCGALWDGCPQSYWNGLTAPGTVTPTVTFSGTPVVPAGKTATITATVSPSNNTMTITLTLSTTSGSGTIVFLNGSSTTTITTTTTLTLLAGAQSSSTPNNIKLTATVTAESQQTPVGSTTLTVGASSGAVPVNFIQTGVSQLSGAVLQFKYSWGSSSGNLSDLSQCQVREFVTYPGYVVGQQGNYYWTSPPYVNTYSLNPDTGNTPGPATGGSLTDLQGNVGFVKPYKANSVPSNQVYQFECPYYQNGQWATMDPASGTIAITRVVQQVGTTWQYTITKSGSSATGSLP